MKLPKLPWWAWALIGLYGSVVYYSRAWGDPWAKALLWPYYRFFAPRDTRPIKITEAASVTASIPEPVSQYTTSKTAPETSQAPAAVVTMDI